MDGKSEGTMAAVVHRLGAGPGAQAWPGQSRRHRDWHSAVVVVIVKDAGHGTTSRLLTQHA